jgi:hypothetical protein
MNTSFDGTPHENSPLCAFDGTSCVSRNVGSVIKFDHFVAGLLKDNLCSSSGVVVCVNKPAILATENIGFGIPYAPELPKTSSVLPS